MNPKEHNLIGPKTGISLGQETIEPKDLEPNSPKILRGNKRTRQHEEHTPVSHANKGC